MEAVQVVRRFERVIAHQEIFLFPTESNHEFTGLALKAEVLAEVAWSRRQSIELCIGGMKISQQVHQMLFD